MHRIDTTTRQVDKFGTGKDGFTDGSPGVTPPTALNATMFDSLQEEIAGVIESTGVALSGASNAQLLKAIRSMLVAQALRNWTHRDLDTFTGANGPINDFVYAVDKKLWVCVGGTSDTTTAEVQSSANDGAGWTRRYNAATGRMQGVAYDGSALFVATGYGANPVCTSPDGATWTNRAAGTFQGESVTYGAGIWVIVGASGLIKSSVDPVGTPAWTTRTPGSSFAADFWKVIFANSLFVAVGGGGGAGEIQTSPDGITWTRRANPSTVAYFTSVAWTGSRFVASAYGSKIYGSADGITWTDVTPAGYGSEGRHVVADVATGVVLVLGNGTDGLWLSTDGGLTFTSAGPTPFGVSPSVSGAGARAGRILAADTSYLVYSSDAY